MILLVGLGNPGRQYENTRHNVGFLFVDELAKELGTTVDQKKFKSLYNKADFEGQTIVFLKPQTFMNVSGMAVVEAAYFFKIPTENIIAVFDDLDQDSGAVRMRVGGGHGGHNGVRDMIQKLGTDKFTRIKVGIGKPEFKGATADWVLSKFSSEEEALLRDKSFPEVRARLVSILREIKI